MPNLEVTGSYVGVESVKTILNFTDATYDALILDHLLAASRDVERMLKRRFFPVIATNYYDWPPAYAQPSAYVDTQPLYVSSSDYYRWMQFDPSSTWWWRLYLNDDLVSANAVQVAATGLGAVPVTITHYFLGPQTSGPPYNRLDIDLSNTDVFQAGTTAQRAVSIAGQWGYGNTTAPAGMLAGAVGSASATSITVSAPTQINQGDVILIDAEALYVGVSPALASGTAVVQRGVNGTTAATHLSAAPIARYQVPTDIRRLVRADAISSWHQDQASWGPIVNANGPSMEFSNKAVELLRTKVKENYAKRQLVMA